MTQLLGNSDTSLLDHTSGWELFSTDMAAAQHTATASGTVEEIHFYLRADSIDTATTVDLGIYADAADQPSALLGRASVAVGTVTGPLWIAVTGLSVAVAAGTKYWLAVMPTGSGVVFYDVASPGSTGTPMAFDNADLHTQLPDPFTATPFLEADGPAGLYATGTETAVVDSPITGLDFHVTGLWYPDAETVDYYGRIADPIAGEVVIPLNDSRAASVTVSVHDPIVAALHQHTYARCLKVYYYGTLIFWGPAKLIEGNSDTDNPETVRISAVDPSLRVIRHYLRRDDLGGELTAASGDRGTVSIDRDGIELLLDAARNIPAQTARGCPDIGIALGTNDFVDAPTDLMGVARGDEVWASIVQLSQSLGPDFELEPVDDTPGVYCNLNTFIKQGADRTATVQLHYGTGLDNLEGMSWVEGSKYVTHDHVLSRDQTIRETVVNVESSGETGQYTEWDVTDFDSHGIPAADAARVLIAFGTDVVKAYGRPLMVYSAKLPVEQTGSGPGTKFRYLRDYALGDTIDLAGKIGLITLEEAAYRITKVTLTQEDDAVRPTLDVVPDLAAGDTISGSEE